MITALDATALIYAMDRNARRSEEQTVCENTHDFIAWLKETQRDEIYIPAPAFAEFLAFYGLKDQAAQFEEIITKGFRIIPTDIKSATFAANIWGKLGNRAARTKLIKELDVSKQCIKTDILIVATALSHGAKRIIAADRGIVAAAQKGELDVLPPEACVIPEIPDRSGSSLFH